VQSGTVENGRLMEERNVWCVALRFWEQNGVLSLGFGVKDTFQRFGTSCNLTFPMEL
jgi:hypothetical protein